MGKKYGRRELEKKIRTKLKFFLESLGWLAEITHGNQFMKGFPDLYICHPKYGARWIDTKVEGNYDYTDAQREKWPNWHKHGVGIWILTDSTIDQYQRLFKPPNWLDYWKDCYGDPWEVLDIDKLLDSIEE